LAETEAIKELEAVEENMWYGDPGGVKSPNPEQCGRAAFLSKVRKIEGRPCGVQVHCQQHIKQFYWKL